VRHVLKPLCSDLVLTIRFAQPLLHSYAQLFGELVLHAIIRIWPSAVSFLFSNQFLLVFQIHFFIQQAPTLAPIFVPNVFVLIFAEKRSYQRQPALAAIKTPFVPDLMPQTKT
jgi:hypothetical protein